MREADEMCPGMHVCVCVGECRRERTVDARVNLSKCFLLC